MSTCAVVAVLEERLERVSVRGAVARVGEGGVVAGVVRPTEAQTALVDI